MEDIKLQAKITQKNRLSLTLIVLWGIVIGLMVYFLNSVDVLTFFATIFLATFVYITLSELVTKTFELFLVRSIAIIPVIGAILFYVLNHFTQRYPYTLVDPSGLTGAFGAYILLALICALSSSASFIVTRLTIGYEALCEHPMTFSYSIKEGNFEKTVEMMKNFLDSLNVTYTTIFRKGQQYLQFYHGKNQYFLFPYNIDKENTEIDFVVIRWRRDTIVKPSEEDIEIFSDYLGSYLNKQRKDNKLSEWTTESKPVKVEISRNQIWTDYAMPIKLRERLALRGAFTQRVISELNTHRKRIVDVVVALVIFVIAQFILRFILHWI
jgi:hypothetical protein